MELFSYFLLAYLVIGGLFAGAFALYMHILEKECDIHSEDKQEMQQAYAYISVVVKNPKQTLILITWLCWPYLLGKSIARK